MKHAANSALNNSDEHVEIHMLTAHACRFWRSPTIAAQSSSGRNDVGQVSLHRLHYMNLKGEKYY